jgi:hypothetical protein
MSRVVLVHWNRDEAARRAAELASLGYETLVFAAGSATNLRFFRDTAADVVVIDLSRMPSHGRAIGVVLRQQKATRHVPLVFVGGAPEKVAPIKAVMPDAAYTDWEHVGRDLASVLSSPPKNPVTPVSISGYSGTPLPKKLRIREGSTVLLLGAPDGFERKLEPLPPNVQVRDNSRSAADVVLLFVHRLADLHRRFASAERVVGIPGVLWIVWPKKTSALAADVGEREVREFGLGRDWVDYKICAVDETWSGLAFGRRKR